MSVEDRSLRLLPVVSRPVLRLQLQSDVCRVIVKYLSVVAKIFEGLPFKKIVPIFPQVVFYRIYKFYFVQQRKYVLVATFARSHLSLAQVPHNFTPKRY